MGDFYSEIRTRDGIDGFELSISSSLVFYKKMTT